MAYGFLISSWLILFNAQGLTFMIKLILTEITQQFGIYYTSVSPGFMYSNFVLKCEKTKLTKNGKKQRHIYKTVSAGLKYRAFTFTRHHLWNWENLIIF